jgi:uncharacterized repeat protein (TIGR01451 family)
MPPRKRLSLEVLEDRVVPSSTLQLEVSAPAALVAGSQMVSTLTVTNAGPDPASGLTLTYQWPSGTSFVSQRELSGPAFSLGTVSGAASDTIGTLASGATGVLAVVVSVVPLPEMSAFFSPESP